MKLNKKELEERVLKLEAIIQAQHEVVQNFCESCPLHFMALDQLDNYITALYNTAEVRENISDLVNLEIEFETNDENN